MRMNEPHKTVPMNLGSIIGSLPGGTAVAASTAGFEEWSPLVAVPDGSNTLMLLGAILIPLGIMRARRKFSRNK